MYTKQESMRKFFQRKEEEKSGLTVNENVIVANDTQKLSKNRMKMSILVQFTIIVYYAAAPISRYIPCNGMNCSSKIEFTAKESMNSGNHIERDHAERVNKNMCSVYIAPSSVPGGGMGMFTVKSVKEGGVILPADGPSIPIIDYDDSQRSLDTWVDLFMGYWWENGISEPAIFEADKTAEYQITCGALPNSHPYLNNLDIVHPDVVPYDDSVMDRFEDPGAGAISNYMGRHSIAYMDIEAGEELFLEYPEEYMNYISDKYNIPNRINYEEASEIISTLLSKYGDDISEWRNKEPFLLASEKVQLLLPKTQHDLDRVLSKASDGDFTTAVAKEMSVKKRSVQWIRENGICLDNIMPGVSSNPRAGKGAIAQRFMAKGEVIAPASTLQITDRDALRMPAFEGEEWQLLLNYCLGHQNTSLLLCPNTNAVLLNHCSDRRPDIHPCGKVHSKPNAKYQWAKWDKDTAVWLNLTVSEMKRQGGRGLSLDVVATRDIEEGEEVFVDYGLSWESAWDEHIKKWEPPVFKNKKWTTAKELNKSLGPLEFSRDLSAQYITNDSHDSLFTGCYYPYYDDDYDDDEGTWSSLEDENILWQDLPIDEAIQKYGADYDASVFAIDENGTYSDGQFWPCVVVDKDEEQDNYIVRIIQSDFHEETIWEKKKLPNIIMNYPRSSIRHFYKPYKSDIHLPGVFRHYMELPDDLFPEIWKNL